MPRYGFMLTRLRGTPTPVHGRRQGTTPSSSSVMIFSVTIPYTSIVANSKLDGGGIGRTAWRLSSKCTLSEWGFVGSFRFRCRGAIDPASEQAQFLSYDFSPVTETRSVLGLVLASV